MTTITLETIERFYKNNGNHAEQVLAYTLTKEVRRHDHIRFDRGSDIPEFKMSVKSSGATLMSGNLCHYEEKEAIITEFFERTASELFAYVVGDFSIAYVMDSMEFSEFLAQFSNTCHESTQNGGKAKVQIYKESQKMLRWFSERV
jgi:hypothetical protein